MVVLGFGRGVVACRGGLVVRLGFGFAFGFWSCLWCLVVWSFGRCRGAILWRCGVVANIKRGAVLWSCGRLVVLSFGGRLCGLVVARLLFGFWWQS